MKKACSYCGQIHDKGFQCGRKTVTKKFSGEDVRNADKFRSSYDWKLKRVHIMKRDKFLCAVCLNAGRLCNENLSVHHIRPLETAFDMRLDDDNLITLCEKHHEMAEKGEISAEKLIEIIPPEV